MRLDIKCSRQALREKYRQLHVPFRPTRLLQMQDIYVPLKVAGASDTSQIDAHEAVTEYRKLMVIAPPGSGKWLQTGQKWLQTGQKWLQTGQKWLQTGQKWFLTGQKWFQTGQKWFQTGQKWLQTGQKWLQTGQKWLQTGQKWFPTGQKSQID